MWPKAIRGRPAASPLQTSIVGGGALAVLPFLQLIVTLTFAAAIPHENTVDVAAGTENSQPLAPF